MRGARNTPEERAGDPYADGVGTSGTSVRDREAGTAPKGASGTPSGRRSVRGGPAASRIVGVDVARGVAVLGMFAVHVFGALYDDGSPTVAWQVAAGRSAATFAVCAGVGLAFTSGGRHPVTGRGVTVSVAVRALLIGVIGLALGWVTRAGDLGDLDVVLPYYALLFLLGIPLLGRGPRWLAWAAIVTAVVGPFVVLGLGQFVTDPGFDTDPTLVDAIEHPAGLLGELLVVGAYPVLAWMAYLCAGLAIGRTDLTSVRTAVRLFLGGLALALASWYAAGFALFHMGGEHRLYKGEFSDSPPSQARNYVLWDDPDGNTWWSMLSRAPHSTAPFDMLHTLGGAAAMLGALLLITRSAGAKRLLAPLAAAGSMPLTFYCVHVLFLATGLLSGAPVARYVVMAAAALLFATGWRYAWGQGPLEAVTSKIAKRARQAVSRTEETS